MADDPRQQDPDRSTILARRAQFVAAALASAGLAAATAQGCNKDRAEQPPEVCLSPVYVPEPDAAEKREPSPPPQVCLSPMRPPDEDDAGSAPPGKRGEPQPG